MRRRSWLGVLLCLASGASPGGATMRAPGFEEAVREAHRDFLAGSRELTRGRRAAGRQADELWDLSRAVLARDRRAAERLSHLQDLVRRGLRRLPDAAGIADLEQDLRERLGRRRVPAPVQLRELLAIVALTSHYHDAQHAYDRGDPRRTAASGLESYFPEPLEREMRGWNAGCEFWRAAMRNLPTVPAQTWDVFSCSEPVPPMAYCRHHLSVELAVLTADWLADMEPAAWPPGGRAAEDRPAAAAHAVDLGLASYCAEFERASKGNPLSLEGFSFEWSLGDCLTRALEAVGQQSWRSSLELCPADDKRGPDVRRAAGRVGRLTGLQRAP